MEISKLTICRQDMIIVSDTDTESNDINSNKKKKHKRKTKSIRNVKLTTMTVNRVVPNCFRQRCQSGHHYHKKTSRNTKYPKRDTAPEQLKYKKDEVPAKSTPCKSNKNDVDIKVELPRDLYSPITVASSSDTYENISSCSFYAQSTDSDELEDLINSTRKRMKNDSKNLNTLPLRKSICATTTQDDYQNISSNDEALNSSIHSMDTVLLYHGDTNRPKSPQYPDEEHLKWSNNNNIDPMLFSKTCNQDTNEMLQKKIQSLSSENNNNMSPMYEISGKVLMEHYLNTNFM